MAASLVEENGLQGEESVVVAYGLSCSKACGIFLDQGSNLYPLHWQVDSSPGLPGKSSLIINGGLYYVYELIDQPRQHVKKQRHYFANKDPSSQSYGFSSSHVWM